MWLAHAPHPILAAFFNRYRQVDNKQKALITDAGLARETITKNNNYRIQFRLVSAAVEVKDIIKRLTLDVNTQNWTSCTRVGDHGTRERWYTKTRSKCEGGRGCTDPISYTLAASISATGRLVCSIQCGLHYAHTSWPIYSHFILYLHIGLIKAGRKQWRKERKERKRTCIAPIVSQYLDH